MTKQIEQALLLLRRVTAPGNFDLDLATQCDGVNVFIGRGISDLQLKRERRDGGEQNHPRVRDLDV
jgi:hypothetical protein